MGCLGSWRLPPVWPVEEFLLELVLELVAEDTEDIPDRDEDPDVIEYMEADEGTDLADPIEY